jgi:hypothetical protein
MDRDHGDRRSFHHLRRTTMSKVGTIEVDVYAVYEAEQIATFAAKANISIKQAESIARERLYRKEYNRKRNQLPEVKAVRKQYNQKRNALAKLLR